MSFSVSAEGGSATPGALIPLCPPSAPPWTTTTSRPAAGSSNDLELDAPVVEQQAIARLRRSHELGVGSEDAARLARRVARADDERLALFQRQRPIAGERAGADLRSAQILHDADMPAGVRGNLADVGEGLGMGLVRAVREVEPEHIDAGGHERVEHVAASARRTDGGDDFGVAHFEGVQEGSRDGSIQVQFGFGRDRAESSES